MAQGTLNAVQTLRATIGFDVYTKAEADAKFAAKESVYTKQETDDLLDGKADKATTLSGYGITDAYTKTETNSLLNGKADADDVYTKSEIDTKIPNTVGSATKPVYVNGGVLTECTHELNKTVPANAVFTDTTYTAGNGLNLSGTSFSAKAGTNVTVDSGGINVNGNGTVASADSGLLSGGTAYTELRPTLDGTWVKNAQTTAINLQKLEGGIEYLYGLLSHQYDQLKKYINGNYYDYQTDSDSKYTKTVPNGAMPYASLDSIGGRTLVWNQLFPQRTISTTAYDGYTVSADGTGAYTITVTAETASSNGGTNHTNLSIPLYNHVVALTTDSSVIKVKIKNVNQESNKVFVYDKESGYNNIAFIFTDLPQGTYTVHPMLTDLTLAFGSGNEPATVDEFRQIFPADFYTYNPGSLLSAGVTSVVSKDSTNTEIATHPIPAEVQALDGYGLSTGAAYNYIDFEAKKFVQNVGSVDLSVLTFGYGPTVGWSATLPNVKNPADDDTAFNGLSATLKATDRNTQATAFSGGTDAGMVSVAGGKVYVGTGSISIVPSGTLIYELDEPVETDISAYITDDNLIEVESGGSLTFPNQHGDDYRIDVPSSETFMVDLQSAL